MLGASRKVGLRTLGMYGDQRDWRPHNNCKPCNALHGKMRLFGLRFRVFTPHQNPDNIDNHARLCKHYLDLKAVSKRDMECQIVYHPWEDLESKTPLMIPRSYLMADDGTKPNILLSGSQLWKTGLRLRCSDHGLAPCQPRLTRG